MGRVKREDKIIPYKVVMWNINKKCVEFYDVMNFLIREVGDKKFSNDSEIKDFIMDKSMWRFWSRCEYEIVVSGFPTFEGEEEKIDVYDQIAENIDLVVEIFKKNLEFYKSNKQRTLKKS